MPSMKGASAERMRYRGPEHRSLRVPRAKRRNSTRYGNFTCRKSHYHVFVHRAPRLLGEFSPGREVLPARVRIGGDEAEVITTLEQLRGMDGASARGCGSSVFLTGAVAQGTCCHPTLIPVPRLGERRPHRRPGPRCLPALRLARRMR